MQFLKIFVQGIVMGIAEGIPGVSGSALALLMGIYKKFIDLLNSVGELIRTLLLVLVSQKKLSDVNQVWQKIDWKFAIPLGLGTVVSLFGFAVVIDALLESYPMQVYAHFLGLAIASLMVPYAHIKWSKKYVIVVVFAAVFIFTLLWGLQNISFTGNSFTPWYIFLVGVLSISGMLFPGVSGGFIMVVFGLYSYIYLDTFKALLRLQITMQQLFDLTIFMLGLIVGFMVVVRLIKSTLEKHKSLMMSIIMGVLIGSLWVLWPFMNVIYSANLIHLNPKVLPWQVDLVTFAWVSLILVVSLGFGVWLSKLGGKEAI
jgi:putative membrane protein